MRSRYAAAWVDRRNSLTRIAFGTRVVMEAPVYPERFGADGRRPAARRAGLHPREVLRRTRPRPIPGADARRIMRLVRDRDDIDALILGGTGAGANPYRVVLCGRSHPQHRTDPCRSGRRMVARFDVVMGILVVKPEAGGVRIRRTQALARRQRIASLLRWRLINSRHRRQRRCAGDVLSMTWWHR